LTNDLSKWEKWETDPNFGIPPDLAKAVDDLGKATNSTLIDARVIANSFRTMHPYLLNQLALGITLMINKRQHDGRLNRVLVKASKELWD
jgi:hypothetical protein